MVAWFMLDPGIFQVPRTPKGERDLTLGLFWRDPNLAASVVTVGRKRKAQTNKEQADARDEREEAARLRFEEKEEERKRVMRAANEVREFWDVDVCMTKAFSNERLEATSEEGEKVALLKEQTEA